jgi:hypothetical protein
MRCFFLEGDTRRDFEGEAGGGVAGRSSMIGRAARGGELSFVSDLRCAICCEQTYNLSIARLSFSLSEPSRSSWSSF